MERDPSLTFHSRISTAVLAATLLAATLASAAAFTQRAGNSISGRVVDHTRKPVGNLWVELLDEVNSTIGRVRSDSSGRFEFPRLSAGVYQVRVVTSGTEWAPQTTRVELAQAMSGAGPVSSSAAGRATEHGRSVLRPIVLPG